MIKLGITGGIGSGKSYVARMLSQKGFAVYDTDSEAKRLMLSDADIRRELIELLGPEVYSGENSINHYWQITCLQLKRMLLV